MPLCRAGTVPNSALRYGLGLAAHRAAKGHSASKTRVNALMTLRSIRGTAGLLALRLFRHALEAVLHVFHLAAEIVDVAFGRLVCGLVRIGRRGVATARRHERLEHRES